MAKTCNKGGESKVGFSIISMGSQYHGLSSEEKLDRLQPEASSSNALSSKSESICAESYKIKGFLLSDIVKESGKDYSKCGTWVLLSVCEPHTIEYVSQEWLLLYERLSVVGMRLEEMDWEDHSEYTHQNDNEKGVVEIQEGEEEGYVRSNDDANIATMETEGSSSSSPLFQKLQTQMQSWGQPTLGVDFVTKTPSGKTVIAKLEMHAVYDKRSVQVVEASQWLELTHYLVRTSSILEVEAMGKANSTSTTRNTASSSDKCPKKNNNIFHKIEAAAVAPAMPLLTKPTKVHVDPNTPLSSALERCATAELPFALINRNGKIIHVNEVWQDTFNYSYLEAVAMYVFALGDGMDGMEVTRAMQDISQDCKTRTLLIEGTTKLGATFPCTLQLIPMLAASSLGIPVEVYSLIYHPHPIF